MPRGSRIFRLLVVLGALAASPSCVYKMGGGLTAGALDEAAGEGKSGGVEAIGDRLVERAILLHLGEQLGTGLISGVGTITPEQRASLEETVDGLITVAALRTGAGLRDEVSPQLRELIRRDIVDGLAAGIRGPVGDSVDATVGRVVNTAMGSVRQNIEDPALRLAIADLLSESIYLAMREGRPGGSSVGETLETTLSENLLNPFETSVGALTETVANRVDESARRTENTLQAIITALVVILGAFVLMYALTRRQLIRERESGLEARHDLQTVGAALNLLDEDTRDKIRGMLHPGAPTGRPAPQRRDDYARKDG